LLPAKASGDFGEITRGHFVDRSITFVEIRIILVAKRTSGLAIKWEWQCNAPDWQGVW